MTSLAKLPWFRHYTDLVRDRKIRRQSYAIRWVWITILTAAAESPHRGVLLLADGDPLDENDLADIGALKVSEVRAGLKVYAALGMVERVPVSDVDPPLAKGSTPPWRVVKWDQRQFGSDTSTARTRAHRARNRGQEELFGNVPDDADGTFRERSRNGPETETETETEPSSSDVHSRGARNTTPTTTAQQAATLAGQADMNAAIGAGVKVGNSVGYLDACAAKRLDAAVATAFVHPTWDARQVADQLLGTTPATPAPPPQWTPPEPTERAPAKVVAKETAAARKALGTTKKTPTKKTAPRKRAPS